jgi:hypothetical protein
MIYQTQSYIYGAKRSKYACLQYVSIFIYKSKIDVGIVMHTYVHIFTYAILHEYMYKP